jgi:hypothetical protein
MFWEMVIAAIGLTVANVSLSSPTVTFIVIHSFLEMTILILRGMVLQGVTSIKLVRLKYTMVALGGLFVGLFMITGDIYWKAALGGASLIADFGNLFISPIFTVLMCRRPGPRDHLFLDVFAMVLSIIHIIEFYPEAVAALLGNLELAAILMASGSIVNLLPLVVYILFATLLGPGDFPDLVFAPTVTSV